MKKTIMAHKNALQVPKERPFLGFSCAAREPLEAFGLSSR